MMLWGSGIVAFCILCRYGLSYSTANKSIFLFFSVVYRCFFSQTRADALKHGFQNITILEKTAKIGLIICCWNTECVSEKIAIR